ncbi:MAG: prolipoprotein diacylglyceryl transferase [Phycisphaerae bacterium]|jgi:phosphatidylglycerol:prolipoprotein diacylglycerol transferase
MSFPLTLGAWLHDLDPFIWEITPGVGLRWYGTAYAAGFMVAYLLLRTLRRRGGTPLSEQQIADAMLVLCMGVMVGGRLGYVAFYDPGLLVSFERSFPWWGLLMLNKGGMSSHGGMIGVLAACWWIKRTLDREDTAAPKVPLLHLMDLTALTCTPGLFFGRLANFVNGELLGDIVARPGQTAPWWSVKFPQERLDGHEPPLDPDQQRRLLELIDTYRVGVEKDEHAYERLVRLLHKGGPTARDIAAKLEPLLAARHPSQLYQAAAEGLVLGLCLLLAWRRPRRPGFIVALFLLLYGALRIVTELYRLPDADLAIQRVAGLSRGQWLSVVMLAFGLLCLWISSKQPDRMGGWGGRTPAAGTAA